VRPRSSYLSTTLLEPSFPFRLPLFFAHTRVFILHENCLSTCRITDPFFLFLSRDFFLICDQAAGLLSHRCLRRPGCNFLTFALAEWLFHKTRSPTSFSLSVLFLRAFFQFKRVFATPERSPPPAFVLPIFRWAKRPLAGYTFFPLSDWLEANLSRFGSPVKEKQAADLPFSRLNCPSGARGRIRRSFFELAVVGLSSDPPISSDIAQALVDAPPPSHRGSVRDLFIWFARSAAPRFLIHDASLTYRSGCVPIRPFSHWLNPLPFRSGFRNEFGASCIPGAASLVNALFVV